MQNKLRNTYFAFQQNLINLFCRKRNCFLEILNRKLLHCSNIFKDKIDELWPFANSKITLRKIMNNGNGLKQRFHAFRTRLKFRKSSRPLSSPTNFILSFPAKEAWKTENIYHRTGNILYNTAANNSIPQIFNKIIYEVLVNKYTFWN